MRFSRLLLATSIGLALGARAPAADEPAGTPETKTLGAIRVAADTEEATGPVDGYNAKRSATGTKTDTPLLETPLSVQVVSRELLDDQQALRVEDAIRNVSGVYVAQGPDGNTMDSFQIRGFQTDSYGATYLDGVKDFSRAPKEMAGLERVEVLKGPAAIMYGRIEPGGMINRVAKRPREEYSTDLEQQVGEHNFFRTTLDSTGALNQEASWLYRATAAFEDSDGFMDFTHNRRLYVAPQVEWRPGERTQIRVGAEYLDDDRSWALTYGTIGDINGPVDIPVETNLFGKDDLYQDRTTNYSLDWSHEFNDSWRVQQRVAYVDRKSNADGSWISEADLDGNYTREFWGWESEKSDVLSTNLELLGHFATGDWQHTLLAGVDFFDEDYDSGGWSWGGTPVASNIHAVNYDDDYRADYVIEAFGYQNDNHGLYLQDQISFDGRWHALLGVRRDDAKYDYYYGTTMMTAEDSATTWRAGLLFQPRPDVSLYTSYVEGFGSSQFDWSSGTAFEPQTSQQFEVGAKWQPHERFGMTMAVFRLIKDNLTMGDPANPLRTILAGEATSDGFELDLSGQITEDWKVVAAYAYTDVRYTNSDTLQGERFYGVPRNGASLWSTYRVGSSGFEFGGGLVWRDSMPGTQRAWSPDLYPYTLDGYTLVDLMAGYSFDVAGYASKVQVNVSNATDERYFPGSYGDMSRIMLGEPRMVLASFRISF